MIFEIRTPPPPLSTYVEMFTFYEGYTAGYEKERLLPEGVIEIIIDLKDTPKAIYDNEHLHEIQSCRGAWVSGMRKRFITIYAGGTHSSMFVIRFQKGMAYPFLQMPVSELNHQVVDADLVFGNALLLLRESLLEVATPDQKFRLVEQYLLQKLRQSTEIPPVVQFAIQKIIANPAATSIQNIVEKTGYSHKHFLVLFSKHVGFNPKQFLRIVKFQQILQELEQVSTVDWTQIAYNSGYYDQAHFINDFKAFSGFSPTEYMRAKGTLLNYIPI